jgi:hypothetical protein
MNNHLTRYGPVLLMAGLVIIAGSIIYASLLLINTAAKLTEVLS